MANRYYASGEQRAARVNELFTAIAPRYDLINDLQSLGLHRRWKRQLLRLAGLRSMECALDLCCGTGDVALGLAESGRAVVGLDFSLPMLVIAQKRAGLQEARSQRSPLARGAPASGPAQSGERLGRAGREADPPLHRRTQVTFLRGDALRIPFRDAEFDVVTISYGLRNLQNLDAGLEEIRRVLKPGGRFLALDFGKPENPMWRKLYFGYLRCFVPCFGRLFCGDWAAYAYILESLVHYPAQRGVAGLMKRLSFRDVRVLDFFGGIMSINFGRKKADREGV